MTGRVLVVIGAALALGIPNGSVAAQDDLRFGVRVGLGISETTFIVGAHANKPIEAVENLSVEPFAQLGFGSFGVDGLDGSLDANFSLFEVGGRARYDIQDDGEKKVFAFAGPVIYRWGVDEVGTVDFSNTDVALTFGGGVEMENGLGVEAALNASAVTDFQIFGRYTFGG